MRRKIPQLYGKKSALNRQVTLPIAKELRLAYHEAPSMEQILAEAEGGVAEMGKRLVDRYGWLGLAACGLLAASYVLGAPAVESNTGGEGITVDNHGEMSYKAVVISRPKEVVVVTKKETFDDLSLEELITIKQKDGLSADFINQYSAEIAEMTKLVIEGDARIKEKKDITRLSVLYYNLPKNLMAEESKFLIDFLKASKGNPIGFCYLPEKLVREKPKQLLRLARRYGTAVDGLLMNWGDEVLEQERKHRKFLRQLRKFVGPQNPEELSLAYGHIPDQKLEDNPADLLKIARAVGKDTGWVYKRYKGDFFGDDVDDVIKFYQVMGDNFGNALEMVPGDLVSDHFKEVVDVAEAMGKDNWLYLSFLNSELFKKNSQKFVEIAQKYKTDAPKIFGLLDETLINHPDFVMKVVEMSGKAVVNVLYAVKEKYKEKQGESAVGAEFFEEKLAYFQFLHEELGITHFHRYMSEYGSSLIGEVILNLQREKNDKPVALILHNKNDWNNAFTLEDYMKELDSLRDGYLVLLHEVDNDQAALEVMKKTADTYGKISLLLLGGHGNRTSLNLGESGYQDQLELTKEKKMKEEVHYFDLGDEEKMKAYTGTMVPEGKIVLVSCSTGEGGEGEDNLANMFHRVFPTVTVYAPPTSSHLQQFKFDGDDLVEEVEFVNTDTYIAAR